MDFCFSYTSSATQTQAKPSNLIRHDLKILLYNPDNGVTRNFMPHLWMFLLKSLTPPGHEVLLIDGNAQPMDEFQIAQYVRDENIGLVGIGAMTRMIAKAYRIADAIRATGVPVVMGGPSRHRTGHTGWGSFRIIPVESGRGCPSKLVL